MTALKSRHRIVTRCRGSPLLSSQSITLGIGFRKCILGTLNLGIATGKVT